MRELLFVAVGAFGEALLADASCARRVPVRAAEWRRLGFGIRSKTSISCSDRPR